MRTVAQLISGMPELPEAAAAETPRITRIQQPARSKTKFPPTRRHVVLRSAGGTESPCAIAVLAAASAGSDGRCLSGPQAIARHSFTAPNLRCASNAPDY